jgi:hypothetical protein
MLLEGLDISLANSMPRMIRLLLHQRPPLLLADPVRGAQVLWVQCLNGSNGAHVVQAKVLWSSNCRARWGRQILSLFYALGNCGVDALENLGSHTAASAAIAS